jgi:hypothetical protein
MVIFLVKGLISRQGAVDDGANSSGHLEGKLGCINRQMDRWRSRKEVISFIRGRHNGKNQTALRHSSKKKAGGRDQQNNNNGKKRESRGFSLGWRWATDGDVKRLSCGQTRSKGL